MPAPDAAQTRRPYPSAGAQYVSRLRLIALNVTGVRPGVYDLDEASRCLRPLAPAPSLDDLSGASMWFTPARGPADRVDLSVVPAVLGLYVEVGRLRARYGLRALRFATLEAGHLAQNLALVAGGAGLDLGMIGGLYDDVAHELFVLDGVDDVLCYLLPVAERAGPDREAG